ncbi:thiamine diphosphokinase [Sphingobacterium sp. KU25419]|nr:thiamine diphosphokinase [Sphingobacterium sp. KU25419]
MSSHHIVRERQEPALLITDVYSIDPELVGQLLEWSPTIITDVNSYEAVTSQTYKVDVIFSPFPIDLAQEHVKTVLYEINYIASALRYLIAEGYKAVNILGSGFDQEILESFVQEIDMVWLHDDKRTIFVPSGFEKWMPAGDDLFLEPLLCDLETSGLNRIGENHFITINDGFFSITFSEPQFCLLTEKL